ncbi:helix-turn-helix domain-containing protein [Streptomyces triculaminicus]|uniref:helix-turn-helix domain-containing protein n=1 Tax=Streptomyces triculaminicus TaxID=2816232 RepID=UPI0037880EA5
MPGPEPLDPYQKRLTELGAAVKKYRLAKGMTQAGLGKAVQLDHTSIAHIERATRRAPRRDVMRRIDDALEARGRIFRLRDHLDDNPDAARVQRYFTKHAKAVKIRQICSYWTPPLLETEDHTRLSLEAGVKRLGGDLEAKVAYRAKLRAIMRRPDAPTLHVVLREAALRASIGDGLVMRQQLLHLIERSHEPNIEIRVLPFNVAAESPDDGFVTIWEEANGRQGAWRPQGSSEGMFVASDSGLAALNDLYDRLHLIALGPEATRSFIAKVVEELYPCLPPIL